ncbi:MAG: hypothetical protein LBU79_04015, partial [Planctomycetota bacterium]|nr:hypothetical protein [Planctomycetota bacterium]
GVLTAVVAGQAGVEASGDTDAFSGELLPRYTWRMELPEEPVFISPLPSRVNYALSLAEHYPGQERLRPAGEPVTTVVRHALRGPLASYTRGGDRAEGDPALWEAALATDIGGPLSPVYGPPGWNFPLHVLVRNDQGDPLRLATLDGIVESPDFATVPASERRGAEDRWLDSTARTLETPGELGLIFHHFFRYCSDSPLPEQPKLIGSHYGLADSHQTVYESLERRWVGRFIGDCDDLAEFFQVITSRQGKLSHVMNLPSHAACGYVDLLPDNSRRFIVLQTGQVLQFNGQSLNEVVEAAYRYFDRNAGESHLTMDAVPILLRFADEETRTPFVLSARIYEDRPYAETMIRVQGYWHENVLYAAILAMREMLATDRDIGNIKELGSLYERVGMYDQSEELRQEELLRVADDPQAKLSVLMDLVELHLQDRNHPRALEYLHAMEEVMQRFTRDNNVPDFLRALAFRSQWAIAMAKLGEAGRAWELMKYDVELTRRQHGYLSEPVLRTLVAMYTNLSLNRAARGSLPAPEQTAMEVIGKELEDAFSRGVFTADDDYTRTIIRYFFLGRYAVARQGREAGLVELAKDGPYPEGERDHTQRGRDITPDDWSWFRIVPQLYHAVAMEFLDQVEYPGLFSPQAARPFLEDVGRAVRRGTGLGSDVAGFDDQMRAEVTLSFINRDLDLFRRTMLTLREKDYSRLYDDLALTFGFNCGLLPLNDFDRWIDAFREYFPGSQHYFKVVYRALDKGNYAHALKMAQATARFFPDSPLLVQEAEFIRSMVPELEARRLSRP